MSDAALMPVHSVKAMDETGTLKNVNIAGEHPLTIRLDGHEIVTLMTIGDHPEELVIGYLRKSAPDRKFLADSPCYGGLGT